MQKHLCLIAVIVTALTLPSIAFCQIKNGKFVVGGEINYYKKFPPTSTHTSSSGYHSSSSFNYRNFSTALNAGWMITDRLEIGAFINYINNLSESTSEYPNEVNKYKSIAKNVGFGPSFRYFQPIVNNFYFFMQLRSGFNVANQESTNSRYDIDSAEYSFDTNTQKFHSIFTNLSPGFSFMPKKWLSIEALVGNIGWTQMVQGSNSTTDFDFRLNLQNIYLGTRIFF